MRVVELDQNPLRMPPLEIVARGLRAIFDFLSRLHRCQSTQVACVYLLYWYKSTNTDTQPPCPQQQQARNAEFTCFTGTKAHILTQLLSVYAIRSTSAHANSTPIEYTDAAAVDSYRVRAYTDAAAVDSYRVRASPDTLRTCCANNASKLSTVCACTDARPARTRPGLDRLARSLLALLPVVLV